MNSRESRCRRLIIIGNAGERTQQLAASDPQLVEVRLESERSGFDDRKAKGFTLLLAKGRRIEIDWRYSEQDLARLIRIVEAV